MSKPASRIGGIDFDAQASAREAARREGKSLGQWLHGAIAERAADLGLAESELGGHERIDAVTAQLERLSGRAQYISAAPSAPVRRPARNSGVVRPRTVSARDIVRSPRDRIGLDADMSNVTGGDMGDEAESLLADAVASLEQHAARSEKRTDEALASFAQLIEDTELRRGRERGAVHALTEQMAALESSLSERFASGDNPIKHALARLEARLDLIGKRSAAEDAARTHAVALAAGPVEGEAMRRLEEKLNTLLQASTAARQDEPGATHMSQIRPPVADMPEPAAPARQRLGDAIAEISKRQRNLDNAAANGWRVPDRVSGASDGPRMLPREAKHTIPLRNARGSASPEVLLGRSGGASVGEFFGRDDAIAARIGARQPTQAEARFESHATPAHPETRGGIGESYATAESLANVEHRLEEIAGRVREALQPRPVEVPRVDFGMLEATVRDLAAKIDAASAPGMDTPALDALQQQVELLATRFAKSEQDLASLPTLASSVRGLFDQVETVRASVETAASHAAREVLRIAADEARRRAPVAAAPDPSADVVGAVQAMLGGVHDMLDKVAGRLSAVESNLAVRREPTAPVAEAAAPSRVAMPDPTVPQPSVVQLAAQSNAARPATQRPAAPKMVVGPVAFTAGDTLREPILPPPGRRLETAAVERPLELDEDAQRLNFIAAARRAAKIAQAEVSVASRERSSVPEANSREGLIVKSRDYVSAHKRPVLMALAAVLVGVGTLALIKQIGSGGGEVVASRIEPSVAPLGEPAPRRLAAVDPAHGQALAAAAFAVPSLTAPAGGTDPIATGSIAAAPVAPVVTAPPATAALPAVTSLPAFAAQSPIAGTLRPNAGLPSGLQAAADAGNAAAQYDLGARYADGRAVARDTKLAALWIGKAAEQGYAPAQYRLASFFEKGVGVPQDKPKAKALYTQAAQAGNPRAMHNLAVMLADGDGHPDYAGATGWFRKAASFGIHDSQYNLAILLARGLGVQQSLIQSYQWFAVAAAQNDADAAHKRDEVGSKLGGNDLAVAKSLAAAFQPRLADPAAIESAPSAAGWDGAPGASHLHSVKSKVSSL